MNICIYVYIVTWIHYNIYVVEVIFSPYCLLTFISLFTLTYSGKGTKMMPLPPNDKMDLLMQLCPHT